MTTPTSGPQTADPAPLTARNLVYGALSSALADHGVHLPRHVRGGVRDGIVEALREAGMLRERDLRTEIVAALKSAAEGRRAYAEDAPMNTAQILLDEAATFDTAVRIVEGDLRSLAAMLPVRMWTQEMCDDLERGEEAS